MQNYNQFYPQYNPMMTYYQQQLQNMQAQQQTQPTIQDGGIVQVKDETAARNYPTAPGVSITLIDETRQHIFVKTMGFNQLEKPIFKKFLLIPEDEQNGGTDGVSKRDIDNTNNDLKTQIELLQSEIEGIKAEIEKLKAEKPKKKIAAKLAREENEDEA